MATVEPWVVLRRRYLLRRPWMRVREDTVRPAPEAPVAAFHVVELPDWVAVLAFTPGGEVLTVTQYRHGVGQASLELPAGAIDAGETPLEAAARELREETGYAAARWEALGTCAPEPSKHTNWAHLFVAFEARPVESPRPEPMERLVVETLSPAELLRRVAAGEVVHGIHLLALAQARLRGLL